MPSKEHARQLGADRADLDDCVTAESEPLLSQNSAGRQAAERRLQQQRQLERICRTPRLVFELLEELRRYHPEIGDDLDRLAAYAAIDPVMLATMGGDRFAANPLRLIGGRR